MEWLKHAFAVEPPGVAEPTDEQRDVADRLCMAIVRRHMTAPALVFLEMARPLSFVGAQTLHFFMPFLSLLADTQAPAHFATFLEQRGAIDYLCRRLERLEAAGE